MCVVCHMCRMSNQRLDFHPEFILCLLHIRNLHSRALRWRHATCGRVTQQQLPTAATAQLPRARDSRVAPPVRSTLEWGVRTLLWLWRRLSRQQTARPWTHTTLWSVTTEAIGYKWSKCQVPHQRGSAVGNLCDIYHLAFTSLVLAQKSPGVPCWCVAKIPDTASEHDRITMGLIGNCTDLWAPVFSNFQIDWHSYSQYLEVDHC